MLSQNRIDELYDRINVLVKMAETSANECIKRIDGKAISICLQAGYLLFLSKLV